MSQGLLFSEPSIAETGVWCDLNAEIDPSEWAGVCRRIGTMSKTEFDQIKAELMGIDYTQTSICQKLKNLFSLKIKNDTGFPLVSLGQGKPGEEGQWEI